MAKCVHEWKVLVEKTLPSAFEQVSSSRFEQMERLRGVDTFFRKTYICILTCTKCGDLNKTIVHNP